MISFPYTSQVTYDANGMPKYDRPSNAEQQRELNKTLYANGVDMRIATAFKVVPNTNMTITVMPGILHIEGVFGFEQAQRTLTVQAAQGADRIDRVVARVDFNTEMRLLDLYVVAGIAAEMPIAPALTRTTSVYEIALADIFVARNATMITTQRITDLRMNNALCGTFTNALGQIDYTPYFTQVQALLDHLRTQITGIEQGSAVMLKSVFAGNKIDSVKKADTLTETLTIASGGTGVTTLQALKAALALDRASNVPDAEKSVKSAAVCAGNAATATNATDHINNQNNPHRTNKNDVGLGEVNNTADNVKRVSYADTAGRANSAGSADSAGTATTSGRADSANAATDGRMMFNGSYIKASGQQMDFFVDNEYYKVRYGVSQTQGWALYPFAQEMPSTIEKASLMLLGTQACPWLSVYSRDGLVQTSDAREKHNIKPLDSRYIDFIMALKPSEFIMNGNEKVSLGLIAQDVEKALKDAGFDDGTYQLLHKPIGKDGRYALNNIDFIAPLLATVQTQQKQIDQLTARLTALESKIGG